MKRITPTLFQEARRMISAWASEEKNKEWMINEVASVLGVSHNALKRKWLLLKKK